ncbi:hypothetical protein GF339_16465 [candidate division KSB3 bacterium]|uniref:Uncharacterized protein n=1 Tax=candidate division KSB3 bacterium TaxID=2044937 RepID=A0A9D5JYK5_9BACT|nr:hypothetical protein [candidate division KSB3 bacterium]MBD3326182.1 hypothetical protein [candidate division KSB3 bacterium]
MKRPAGITILGLLFLLTGGMGLLAPADRPLVFFGMLHTGRRALAMRLVPNLGRLYVGLGLLKPFRHIWYLYIIGACIGIGSLSVNLAHETKLWELYLRLESRPEAIPRLVQFTIETHYLFIAIYALTAMYVYLQKNYFWGDDNL